MTVEYQARQQRSRLVILDAADLGAGPIAAAQLRHHLPQGFHGSFRRGHGEDPVRTPERAG